MLPQDVRRCYFVLVRPLTYQYFFFMDESVVVEAEVVPTCLSCAINWSLSISLFCEIWCAIDGGQ